MTEEERHQLEADKGYAQMVGEQLVQVTWRLDGSEESVEIVR